MVITPTLLRAHIGALCEEHGLKVFERADYTPDTAAAQPEAREVVCRPIVNDTSYAVALHEIGHLLAPGGTRRAEKVAATSEDEVHRLRVQEERAAWAWAKAHALEWTVGMEQVFTWALATYTEAPARRAAARAAQTVATAQQTAAARAAATARAKALLAARYGWRDR